MAAVCAAIAAEGLGGVAFLIPSHLKVVLFAGVMWSCEYR